MATVEATPPQQVEAEASPAFNAQGEPETSADEAAATAAAATAAVTALPTDLTAGGSATKGPARDALSAKDVGQFLVRPDVHAAALSSLIDAHNGLVRRLSQVQAQLDMNFEIQAQASKDLRKLTSRLEDGTSDTERRFEDLHKQVKESHEAAKCLAESKSSALEEKLVKAHQDLDALVQPRMLGLERALEDLASSQAEFTSKTLPRWRADVGAEIQKLAGQHNVNLEKSVKQAQDHEAQLAAQSAALEEHRANLEKRLEADTEAMRQRLATAEENSASLASELASAESRLRTADGALHERLQEHESKLEVLTSQGSQARGLAQVQGESHSRLEDAFKQADLERLAFETRIQRELEALRTEHGLHRQSGDEQHDAHRSLLQGELARVRSELEACLATKAEVQELSGKLESTKSHGQQAENSGASAVAQVAAQVHKLEEKVDQECSRLSAEALQAGAKALDAVRGDETLRLNKLEQSMPEAFNACFAAEERVKQDLQKLREELKAAEALTSSRLDSTNGALTSKMEPVQDAVDVLTKEIHSFMQLQTEQHEEQGKVLEVVKAMEGRLWPHRKSRLGPEVPGSQPGLDRARTEPTEFVQREGSAATREPTPKAASRPPSARGQRPDANVAGAALGAARAARGLKVPPQRPATMSLDAAP